MPSWARFARVSRADAIREQGLYAGRFSMEPTGIEPLTSCLQSASESGRLRV
jgi:hypothetical protein